MASGPPAQALATHLISQTLASVSLLETLSLISPSDAGLIRSKLPNPYGPFPTLAGQQSPSHQFNQLPPPQQQQQQQQITNYGTASPKPSLPPRSGPQGGTRARALWDYNGDAGDLHFRAGDTVIIDEEVNQQWFRGRVIPNGQQHPLDPGGLFPSNYIEKMPTDVVPYYAAPQPYQPPSQAGGYYQTQPQPMPTQMMNPPQQGPPALPMDAKKPSKFGKIGGQLGNAAINGAGFGFGATIASDMVNKIF